jgi:hypothetical protein
MQSSSRLMCCSVTIDARTKVFAALTSMPSYSPVFTSQLRKQIAKRFHPTDVLPTRSYKKSKSGGRRQRDSHEAVLTCSGPPGLDLEPALGVCLLPATSGIVPTSPDQRVFLSSKTLQRSSSIEYSACLSFQLQICFRLEWKNMLPASKQFNEYVYEKAMARASMASERA